MACKANPQHLRLLNRLKKIDKYKASAYAISIQTWSHESGTISTTVDLWSAKLNKWLFQGTTISELERFINSERKKAGIFQEKIKGGKK